MRVSKRGALVGTRVCESLVVGEITYQQFRNYFYESYSGQITLATSPRRGGVYKCVINYFDIIKLSPDKIKYKRVYVKMRVYRCIYFVQKETSAMIYTDVCSLSSSNRRETE